MSPIAFEDLSGDFDLPNGEKENKNLKMYTDAMKEVADRNQVLFVDAYSPSSSWFSSADEYLTIDGFQLTEEGYKKFSTFLTDKVFGSDKAVAEDKRAAIHAAVKEKIGCGTMIIRFLMGSMFLVEGTILLARTIIPMN